MNQVHQTIESLVFHPALNVHMDMLNEQTDKQDYSTGNIYLIFKFTTQRNVFAPFHQRCLTTPPTEPGSPSSQESGYSSASSAIDNIDADEDYVKPDVNIDAWRDQSALDWAGICKDRPQRKLSYAAIVAKNVTKTNTESKMLYEVD